MAGPSGHSILVVALAEPAARPDSARETALLSLRDVFDAHAAFVLRNLRRLGVAEADLDDAAQDVFLVVHRNLERYDAECALRSWLFGIVQRVAANYRRRGQRRRECAVAEVSVASVEPTQLEHVALQQAQRLLLDALDQLEPTRRAIFILYELEEMPMSDVAQAVACPLQTAYSRLYAARDTVRTHILRAERGRR